MTHFVHCSKCRGRRQRPAEDSIMDNGEIVSTEGQGDQEPMDMDVDLPDIEQCKLFQFQHSYFFVFHTHVCR